MKIIDNFSENHLLFSEPVQFFIYQDEQQTILLAEFTIKLPTVRDVNFNSNVITALGLLRKTMPELKKEFGLTLEINSHIDLINAFLVLKDNVPALISYLHRTVEGLKFLCPDITVSHNKLCLREIEINDELFEKMKDIWLIAAGAKNYSQAYKYMSPHERELEAKIQAIKNKGKSNNSSTSFEKIYIILTYEFGYTRDAILNMTMHTVKTILKYTSKSINYKLTLIAKANGNTKKVKFIADKGD